MYFIRWFVSVSGHWVEEKLKKLRAGAQPKVSWFPGHSGCLQVLLLCWQCTAAPEKSEDFFRCLILKYGTGLVIIPRCSLAKRPGNNKRWLSEGRWAAWGWHAEPAPVGAGLGRELFRRCLLRKGNTYACFFFIILFPIILRSGEQRICKNQWECNLAIQIHLLTVGGIASRN